MKRTLTKLSATLLAGGALLASAAPALAQSDDAAAAGIFGTTMLISICCPFLVWFAIGGAIAWWVKQDAEKNNVDNPILWAILAFFFTIPALLIYFLAIRNKGGESGGSSEGTA